VRIAFLTTDDPLYLPDFFDRVLAIRNGQTVLVAIVPPLYAKQRTRHASGATSERSALPTRGGSRCELSRRRLCGVRSRRSADDTASPTVAEPM